MQKEYVLEFLAEIVYRAEATLLAHEGYYYLLLDPKMSETLEPCPQFDFENYKEVGIPPMAYWHSEMFNRPLQSISPVSESCVLLQGRWVPKEAVVQKKEISVSLPEEKLCVFVNGAWTPKPLPESE